jgi:hypothetical protein
MGETAHRDGRNQNLVRAPFQAACRYRHTQGFSPGLFCLATSWQSSPSPNRRFAASPLRRFAVSPFRLLTPGFWLLTTRTSMR